MTHPFAEAPRAIYRYRSKEGPVMFLKTTCSRIHMVLPPQGPTPSLRERKCIGRMLTEQSEGVKPSASLDLISAQCDNMAPRLRLLSEP